MLDQDVHVRRHVPAPADPLHTVRGYLSMPIPLRGPAVGWRREKFGHLRAGKAKIAEEMRVQEYPAMRYVAPREERQVASFLFLGTRDHEEGSSSTDMNIVGRFSK